MQKTYRRVIQIELNEISSDIVQKLIDKNLLPTFKSIQSTWTHIKTRSETQYELIEPWIQWVTAHTGKTFDEHGIFRLGDIQNLQHPQIWEILAEKNIESAVLGCMNVSRGKMGPKGFFFPDPWSKSGETWPEELQPLWKLVSSKVQGHAVTQPGMLDFLRAFQSTAQFDLPISIYMKVAKQFLEQKIDPLRKWKLAAIFDEFLGSIFLHLLDEPRYRFCTIFLNAVAHYQHHYWRNHDRDIFSKEVRSPDCNFDDDPIAFGYQTYDRILGRILKKVSREDTLVMIASGLSQVPYLLKEDEGGMNYYRLKNHQGFLDQCGLFEGKAFPMMSRDWQVTAPTAEAMEKIRIALDCLNVDGEKLFKVDAKRDGYLFIETSVTRKIQAHEIIKLGDRAIGPFHGEFVNIAVKSGHHTGIGSLWISEFDNKAAKSIPLTQIFDIGRSALLN